MATQIQWRRGNTSQTATFTGAVSEITVDTDKNTLVVHNGTTPGGFPLAQDSSTQANVGAGLIIVTNAYQANVGAARIADVASGQANVGAVQIAKLDKSGGTISGSLIVTGNTTSGNLTTANTIVVGLSGTIGTSLTVGTTLVVTGNTTAGNITPTTDNVSSLGSVSKRWKDLFVGPGSINIDGIVIGNINGQIVISGASDFVFQSTTGAPSVSTASSANIALNAFNQANLAYNAANTAVTTGQANVGAARIADVASGQANVGAARIADVASGQANVGAGLIIVTNAYQANVGQLRLDTSNANTSLAANIGAARIADVASGQANVGAGLIIVTNAYQANVGAARIADVASGQANVGAVQIAKLDKSGGTISGSLIVTGDLTISGNTTTINTTELNIADNEIVLNTDWPANVYPTQNAGITINRGTVANSPNVFIRWNETDDYWVLGANVGEFIIATTANTGAGDITVTNAYQANVGAARIADVASGQANVGAGNIIVTNAFQANTGAVNIGLSSEITNRQANVGAARIADVASGQANTGAGNITVTNAFQANVGAARIADVASGQANVGAVQIAKVNKSGDVMTGTLTTNSEIIGSSITANNTLTINTNAVYESYTSTTSTTSQFALDTFSTSTYRSAKYLVQISSGSAYELIELSLIHDGTNVYLSQYGNIKSGSTLGVFDSTISTGVLSLLATPNNAITTFRAVATLITV